MRTIDDLKQIAKEHGWTLNINQTLVKRLLVAENKHNQEEGNYYCPCKIDHSEENVCPCLAAPTEIKTTGHCHCSLFFAIPK